MAKIMRAICRLWWNVARYVACGFRSGSTVDVKGWIGSQNHNWRASYLPRSLDGAPEARDSEEGSIAVAFVHQVLSKRFFAWPG